MSESPTPPGSSEPEPPAAPQFDAPAPPPPAGGGYTPPPPLAGQVAPAGYANSDEKTWALLAHFGGIILGFVAPLIAFLVKGNESQTVRAHSLQALNFQITWGIATIVAFILGVVTCGLLAWLPIVTWIVIVVFSIIGGMKANEGVLYKYPMSFELIK